MGRPAEQIEALQARVRELEGRCRAVTERASGAVELLREIEWNGRSAGEHTCPCCNGLEGDHDGNCKLAALIGPVVAPFAAVPPVLVAGEVLDEPRCGKPDPEGRACTLAADHARPDDHDGKPGPYTGAAALVMGGPLPPLLADEDDA